MDLFQSSSSIEPNNHDDEQEAAHPHENPNELQSDDDAASEDKEVGDDLPVEVEEDESTTDFTTGIRSEDHPDVLELDTHFGV